MINKVLLHTAKKQSIRYFLYILFLSMIPWKICAVEGAPPNPIIQNLPNNTWYEVLNSKMFDVEAKNSDFPGIWGNHPNSIDPQPSNFQSSEGVFPWSGAVLDSKLNRLVLWGGGHNSYYGNELYAFDLTTLSWERVNNPSPPTDWANCTDILADGSPNSRHTYYNLAYLPTIDKFFSTPAGTTSCEASGPDYNTWTFDFSSKEWFNLNPDTESYGNGLPMQPPVWAPTAATYNPLDDKVYSVGPEGLFVYDITLNRWDRLDSTELWGDRGMAVDVKRGLLVVIGRGEVVIYDIVNQNYIPQFWDTIGDEGYNINNAFRPGVNYDPIADRIVVWDGGAVHALNMDTQAWDDLAIAPQLPFPTGTYGRFRYNEHENAYVLVNGSKKNVLIYKLSAPTALDILIAPKDIEVNQGQIATFKVFAIGDDTISYQWYKNGVAITGAISPQYSIVSTDMTNNGATFKVVVSNSSGNVTSSEATLFINADTISPTILAAFVIQDNRVDVMYSEEVTAITAENIDNYQFNLGINIISAVLSDDQKTVKLQTSPLSPDISYTVTVNNIRDISTANQIAVDSQVDLSFEPMINFDDGLLPLNWTPLTETRWSVVNDNASNALFLNTSSYSPLSGNRLGEYIISSSEYQQFSLNTKARFNEPSTNSNADYALLFGFQDENNYYYMIFNKSMNNTQLYKVIDGARELIATATSDWLNDNNYHNAEVRRVDSFIEIRFDDNVVIQTNDSTFSSGKVGLGSYNDSAYFDDVRISRNTSTITDLIFSNTFE